MRNLLRSLPEPALSAVEGVEMTAKEIGYGNKLHALEKGKEFCSVSLFCFDF